MLGKFQSSASCEVSAPCEEPLAGVTKGARKQYKPLKCISLEHLAGEFEEGVTVMDISDDDDKAGDAQVVTPVPLPPACADANDLVLFRVPHKHPHMLKRPLQHVDGLHGLHYSVRLYSVASPSPDAHGVPSRHSTLL